MNDSLKENIKLYVGILKKRRYLALSAALIVVSAFTWGSFIMPKSYQAESTVFVQRSDVLSPLMKGVGITASIEDRLRTLKDSMLSRNLIERVIKKLDLDVNAKSPQKYEMLIDGLRNSITVTIKAPHGEADLFTIAYTGSDQVKCRDIVNTLVNEYIGENLGFRRSDAYSAFEFIQNQLMEYKAKLEDSDKEIREFRERNPRMIPQSEATLSGRMDAFQSAKIESEIRLQELLRRRDSLQKQLSGEKQLTVAFVTKEGSPQARLSYLNSQLILLMSKYTEKHPEIIKIKAEIEDLKQQIAQAKNSPVDPAGSETSAMNPIYEQLREDMAKTDAEIETMRAREGELSKQEQATQGILGAMPAEQQEWEKLQGTGSYTKKFTMSFCRGLRAQGFQGHRTHRQVR